MKNEPLEQLKNFYKELNDIPTPPLASKPPREWGILGFVLAPVGASITACVVMVFCANSPVEAGSSPHIPVSLHGVALDESSVAKPVKQPRIQPEKGQMQSSTVDLDEVRAV